MRSAGNFTRRRGGDDGRCAGAGTDSAFNFGRTGNPWSAHGTTMAALLSSRLIAPIFLRAAPHLQIAYSFVLRRLYGDTARIRPGTLEGYSAPLVTPGAFDSGISVLRSWTRDLRQLKSMLPRIAHIPTLLIWGSMDAAVDPLSATRLRENFENCRLVMFEGAGHLPYEEVPDQFNNAGIEFLEPGTPGNL